jgi:SulP family sulfate permease
MPTKSSISVLAKAFPFLPWLKGYSVNHLKLDLIAGLTVAMVLIPQSMAYARLAELPAYYGLYAALLPPLVAALFGSSQQLATGPVAIVSLMTAASLGPLAQSGSEGYIAYAILLSLVVGVVQLALGALRLGLVVNFISHPVVNGFTNASALIIASSQLATFFGVQVDKAPHYYETIFRVAVAAWERTHLPTLLMGLLGFTLMYFLKRRRPGSPYVLVAVVVATILSWVFGFENERTVSLKDLEGPRVAAVVTEYNQTLDRATAHLEERNRLNSHIFDLEERPGKGRLLLDLSHQAEISSYLAEQEAENARLLREKLRSFRFKVWESGQGDTFFHPEDAPPPAGAGSGFRPHPGSWRLSLGSGRLDRENITLRSGGEVVGAVPPGLPALEPPRLDWRVLPQFFSYALIISLLGFMEAISVAKAMAAQTGQRLDPNQELIGQGLANIAGSFTGSYPVSGSFSRSALNLQAGARTFMSSVFTSLAVVLVLIFFTPLMYHLPLSVLAGVIMLAVVGLVNVSGIVHAWRAQRHDGIIAVISFVATLGFAPHLDRGILIGAGLSLLVFLYKVMRPKVALLALGDDQVFHEAKSHGLGTCDRIAVIRFDGPLFYANAAYLEDKIAQQRRNRPNLRHILLDCEEISDLDASGEETLSLIVDRIRSAGQKISLAAVHLNMLETMERTHLLAKIGSENIYPTVAGAVAAVHRDAHRGLEEGTVCPLQSICPQGSDCEEESRDPEEKN